MIGENKSEEKTGAVEEKKRLRLRVIRAGKYADTNDLLMTRKRGPASVNCMGRPSKNDEMSKLKDRKNRGRWWSLIKKL